MQISSFKVSLESTDFKCNSSTFSIPNAWFPFIFGLQSRTMRFWPEDLNHLHAVYGCNHLLMNAGIWSCRALKMIAKILVWTYGDPGWRRQIGCHIRTLGGSLAAAGWTICKRSNKWLTYWSQCTVNCSSPVVSISDLDGILLRRAIFCRW